MTPPASPADLSWHHEPSPTWDTDKQRVIGGAPPGALDLHHADGAPLPGDWWAARTPEGAVVGYGWLDATWGGDAEILLAVDAASQQRGVGSFVLGRLEDEAARRGLNYVYNTVRDAHPQRDDLHDWLSVRGYRGSVGGSGRDTTLRKRVGADDQRPAARGPSAEARPGPSRAASGGAPGEGDRAPGHEESGGYVDVDDHRY